LHGNHTGIGKHVSSRADINIRILRLFGSISISGSNRRLNPKNASDFAGNSLKKEFSRDTLDRSEPKIAMAGLEGLPTFTYPMRVAENEPQRELEVYFSRLCASRQTSGVRGLATQKSGYIGQPINGHGHLDVVKRPDIVVNCNCDAADHQDRSEEPD
jgi:hypothetical protein